MAEASTRKISLVYIQTGTPYSVSCRDNEKVNEQVVDNQIYSRVGSLHHFLLRNTNLIKFEIEDYHHSGDGYEEYGLDVKALFYIDCDENGLENYEIIGAVNLLTSAGEEIWAIDIEGSIKLYEDTYLKTILGNQLFEQYLIKKDLTYFSENWNLKDYKNTKTLEFDFTIQMGIKDKLGFHEWLFQMCKQAQIDDIVFDVSVKSSVLDRDKRDKIKYSKEKYILLKPNVGK